MSLPLTEKRILSRKWLVGALAFLGGCSFKTPTGPICVSCKPYYCRGNWHHPQTYYEYDKIGLASWYGDDCHGKPKASGEKFNKMAMTAAHKTLPIPSVVRVTNLRNGKSVVVVIDDRGPFVYSGRIIDLSYNAAKALDLHRYKPSNVRVQTLVADSLKLSQYISHYCKRRRDPFGRTWDQLYFQEIKKIRMPIYSSVSEPVSRVSPSSVKNSETVNKRKRKHSSLGGYLNKI